MNEMEALIGRAERYIRSSELLLNDKDFDSSTSRSYYAMFYAAEAVLLTKNLKFKSHRGVISLFGKYFIKAGIFNPKLGKYLRNAYDKRLVGNYGFVPQVNEEDAKSNT
jgi:uncharacterized protein (UPF0332 family)